MDIYKMSLLLLLASTVLISYTQATLATEAAANAVQMKFYRAQIAEWESGGHLQTFSALLSAEATSFCANDPATCGLTMCCDGTAFKDVNIQKVTGYPEDSEKDMLMKIYIDLPAGVINANTTGLDFVLSQSVVQILVGNIIDSVKSDTSYYITYVDTIYYGIPPPVLENSVIIPIACVVLLVMIIITIVCVVVNKKRQKAKHREDMLKKKQAKTKTSKVTPTYDVDETEPRVPSGPDERKPTDNRDSKEKMYEDRELKSRSRQGGAESGDRADTVDEVGGRHTNLPPLDDEARRERKKKKKSKKHRHEKEGSDNYAAVPLDQPTTEL